MVICSVQKLLLRMNGSDSLSSSASRPACRHVRAMLPPLGSCPNDIVETPGAAKGSEQGPNHARDTTYCLEMGPIYFEYPARTAGELGIGGVAQLVRVPDCRSIQEHENP